MDEKLGRAVAIERGLKVIGTIGVIEAGGLKGFLNVPETIERLRKTNFRIDEQLVRELLGRIG